MLIDGTDLGLVLVETPRPRFTGPEANQMSCMFTMAARRVRLGPIAPGSARVQLVGGSPMLTVAGQPVLWYENWLRNREEIRRGV